QERMHVLKAADAVAPFGPGPHASGRLDVQNIAASGARPVIAHAPCPGGRDDVEAVACAFDRAAEFILCVGVDALGAWKAHAFGVGDGRCAARLLDVEADISRKAGDLKLDAVGLVEAACSDGDRRAVAHSRWS